MKYKNAENEFHTDNLSLYQMDCMELLKQTPDKYYDLAIVDPPFGINASKMQMGKGKNKKYCNKKDWDKNTPDDLYFEELIRCSKNQIIWGGNYFNLPLQGGWIFWDKDRNKDVSFGDGELAWCSMLNVIKKVTVKYDGFLGADINRIHSCQKPIKLYNKLLHNYAEPNQKILDTHLGGMSSAIACHYGNVHLTGCELDADYFKAGIERVEAETRQLTLF